MCRTGSSVVFNIHALKLARYSTFTYTHALTSQYQFIGEQILLAAYPDYILTIYCCIQHRRLVRDVRPRPPSANYVTMSKDKGIFNYDLFHGNNNNPMTPPFIILYIADWQTSRRRVEASRTFRTQLPNGTSSRHLVLHRSHCHSSTLSPTINAPNYLYYCLQFFAANSNDSRQLSLWGKKSILFSDYYVCANQDRGIFYFIRDALRRGLVS